MNGNWFLLNSICNRICLSLLVFGGLLFSGSTLVSGADLGADFGLAGHYRTGRWASLRISGGPLSEAGVGGLVEVETLDGDGVRYVQRHRLAAAHVDHEEFWTYCPAGPVSSPLEVRVFKANQDANQDANMAPLAKWSMRLLEGSVSIERPWVLTLGDTLGIDRIGQSDLLGLTGSLDVSPLMSAEELPDNALGYDGVDFIVISGSAIEILRALQPSQQQAIEQWVSSGGKLMVSLGERGPEILAALPWLVANTTAATSVEPPVVLQMEPNAVETYIIAREPLKPFVATKWIGSESGREKVVLLEGYSANRQSFPLIWRENLAFGVITYFAGGLDAAPFVGWKQREEFLGKILPGLIPERRQRGESRGRSELRYSELAGQMRANLDRFEGAGRVHFSVLAAIILVLAGLIGPVDYFVVNRWLGRPLLGWLTFPLTILLFTAALMFWRGAEVHSRVRQVTIVDIDPVSKSARGFTWAQVFSGSAQRLDLEVTLDRAFSNPLDADSTQSQASVGQWGFAGNVFGGIEVAGEDIRLPRYEMAVIPTLFRQASSGESLTAFASSLRGVPFAPQSSKAIVARWQFVPTEQISATLQRRLGSDLLTGELTNPLSHDLIDGFLVYKNLIYQLPTRIPAAGTVPQVDALPAKNFRWRLNRRESTEESSESELWDPQTDDNLSRLMEIVLFYQAAGGLPYVNLQNRTLGALDLTHVLGPDHAILVGKLRDPVAQVQVQGQASPADPLDHETFVRIILPVGKSNLPMPKIPSPSER